MATIIVFLIFAGFLNVYLLVRVKITQELKMLKHQKLSSGKELFYLHISFIIGSKIKY